MSDLDLAVERGKSLGKLALYFGCLGGLGHFLYTTSANRLYSSGAQWPLDLPWGVGLMDGTLLKNGNVPDIPTGKVFWTCGGAEAFWYAFYWWDRSVDKRMASNSGFYVRGFGYPEAEEAFAYACSRFPQVVSRQPYPLVLHSK